MYFAAVACPNSCKTTGPKIGLVIASGVIVSILEHIACEAAITRRPFATLIFAAALLLFHHLLPPSWHVDCRLVHVQL